MQISIYCILYMYNAYFSALWLESYLQSLYLYKPINKIIIFCIFYMCIQIIKLRNTFFFFLGFYKLFYFLLELRNFDRICCKNDYPQNSWRKHKHKHPIRLWITDYVNVCKWNITLFPINMSCCACFPLQSLVLLVD